MAVKLITVHFKVKSLRKYTRILILIFTLIQSSHTEDPPQDASNLPKTLNDDWHTCQYIKPKYQHNRKDFYLTVLLPFRQRSKSEVIRNFSFCMERISPAIDLALERIRKDQILSPEYTIHITYADSACNDARSMNEFLVTYMCTQVDAFIGPVCDYALAPIARQVYFWNIPILTGGGIARDYAIEHKVYTHLTRTGPTFNSVTRVVEEILKQFGWTRVYLMYEKSAYGNFLESFGHLFAAAIHEENEFLKEMNATNVTMDYSKILPEFNATIKLRGDEFNSWSIIMICAPTERVRDIMLAAYRMGYNNDEYVFINIDLFSSSSILERPWYIEGATDNDEARKAFEPMLTLTMKKSDTAEWKGFSNEVRKLGEERYGENLYGEEEVDVFVGAFHDAIILYATALNETITAGGNVTDGLALSKRMWSRTFQGIAGPVTIDEIGDRDADYSLLYMNKETGKFEIAATYSGNKHLFSMVVPLKSLWLSGVPPPSIPKCGFNNAKCPPLPIYVYIIIALVATLALVTGLVVYLTIFRKDENQWEKSIIRKENIRFESSIEEPEEPLEIDPLLEQRSEVGSNDSGDGQNLARAGKVVFCKGEVRENPTAENNNWTVAGLKSFVASNDTLDENLKQELVKLKGLRGDNVAHFIGICLEPGYRYIITDYCKKGSLKDVLKNEITLDQEFKLNIMADIFRGLAYIHNSEIKVHGRLKSSNCLVANTYVIKLTDFGLSSLRTSPTLSPEDPDSYYEGLLWTAPEILRKGPIEDRVKLDRTKEGDVYSFGIICQEIIYRKGVFWRSDSQDQKLTYKEILDRVKNVENPPFRPTLDDKLNNDRFKLEFFANIRKCLDENENERKIFSDKTEKEFVYCIHQEGKKEKEAEKGFMDNLILRLEFIVNHLEDLVKDRTKQLDQQKERVTELLYQMIPVSVAKKIINHEPNPPEKFDSVTIYFSDICQFTKLCRKSKPEQIVHFLNELWKTFDKIVGDNNVYKVETIGDAYMIVSGLPEKNGDNHSYMICKTALDLLRAVRTFVIPHRPDKKLKIRIGIHSGPVCAGIVGTKMPRYCLFGDTVNTASRMESNGLPLMIHLSPDTKILIDQFQCFEVEFRGPVDMKGKGTIETWWLLGMNTEKSPVASLPKTWSTHTQLEEGKDAPANFSISSETNRQSSGRLVELDTIQSLPQPHSSAKIYWDNGFQVFDNFSGGNCFYQAVQDQLNSGYGIRRRHQSLRQEAVSYVDNHRDLLVDSCFVEGQFQKRSEYLDHHYKDGVWCDEAMVRGLAESLRVIINIVHDNGHTTIITPQSADKEGYTKEIFVGLIGESHYVSLRNHGKELSEKLEIKQVKNVKNNSVNSLIQNDSGCANGSSQMNGSCSSIDKNEDNDLIPLEVNKVVNSTEQLENLMCMPNTNDAPESECQNGIQAQAPSFRFRGTICKT